MIYNLYKERGETPLERIQRFAKAAAELKGQKMTYMGRLDPLAEGVLLMASGEDVNRKEEFLGLDKEYDFVALFGFATDTYDVMGRIMRVEKLSELDENEVRRVSVVYQGEREQKYPLYSSKIIDIAQKNNSLERTEYFPAGKSPRSRAGRAPKAALENHFSSQLGMLDENEIPAKKITIHQMQFHKLETLNSKELFGRLLMDISRVNGDFRQNQILSLWKEILFGAKVGDCFIGKFSAHVSSGTYIRGIVNDLGNTLGCGATTLSIKRNRVGDFKVEDSIK